MTIRPSVTTSPILATRSLATTSPQWRTGAERDRTNRETQLTNRGRGICLWVLLLVGIGLAKTSHAQSELSPPPFPSQFPSLNLSSPDPKPSSQEIRKRRPLETTRFTFDPREDRNFDKWPDGWKRFRGVGYPAYVFAELTSQDASFDERVKKVDQSIIKVWQAMRESAIQIDQDFPWLAAPSALTPTGIPFAGLMRVPSVLHGLPALPPSVSNLVLNGALRIELDGGQFKAQSPVMPSSAMHQYRMSCRIRTQGLRYDAARFELIFFREVGSKKNPQIEELMTVRSELVRGSNRWTRLMIEMVQPPPQTTGMMARLIVERSADGLEDIRGNIEFDDVRIEKHPQLMISSDQKLGVYSIDDPITIESNVLGLHDLETTIHLQLLDSSDRLVEETELSIAPRQSQNRRTQTKIKWSPKPPGAGFYQVLASIDDAHVGRISAQTTLAVLDPALNGSPHGPFGWTMPRNDLGITTREYARWLNQLGVAWVKYPCWIDSKDVSTAEETASLLIRLQDSGIETVGLLDQPPPEQVSRYGLRGRNELVAAQVFRDINTWQPELESVMSRLTLKVRRWQLGGDDDYSFVGRPRLKETVEQISKGLQGYGQPLNMTINWPWMETHLPHHETSWQAVSRGNTPSMQAHELHHFLTMQESAPQSSEGPATWLLIDPIDKTKYSREDRVRDLMLRMATVRSHRVEAAFVSKPFDPKWGLLDANGRPSDLLLPWRTTSRLIGDLRKVGALKLRGRSQNIVFAGADRAVVMIWSAKPSVEKIYFGQKIQQVDAWGRIQNLKTVNDASQPHQVIEVGPVPTFIVAADPMLIAFRMSVEVEPKQFDSLLGEMQNLKVLFSNPLRDPIVGVIRVAPPKSWQINDSSRSWEALGGRSASQSFEVTLGNTATIGVDEIPIQFELDTVPPKRITVYRNVKVGPEGLEVKLTTRLMPSGELRVRIRMTNNSSRSQSYNSLLFAPGRQYHSTFMTVEGNDILEKDIYFEGGEELVGHRMTLRAIEQDGSRVLNYTFDARR